VLTWTRVYHDLGMAQGDQRRRATVKPGAGPRMQLARLQRGVEDPCVEDPADGVSDGAAREPGLPNTRCHPVARNSSKIASWTVCVTAALLGRPRAARRRRPLKR
jgi:hypothetical protein